MGVQIITDFNATGKISAVQDEKHIEIIVEGRAGDNLKAVAKLAAQIVYDTAKQVAESGATEVFEHIDAEALTDTQKATIVISNKLKGEIDKELGAAVLKDQMKEQGIPAEIIDGLADAISKIGYDIVSNKRDSDDEEGDEE